MSRRPSVKATRPVTNTDVPRGVLGVIIVGIIIVVAFAIVPFLLQLFAPQPLVSLGNVNPSISGCGTGQNPYYTYSWQFTLTNTGNVNANVTVGVVPGSGLTYGFSPLTTRTFSIPKATQTGGTITISRTQQGCAAREDLTIQIISTVQA